MIGLGMRLIGGLASADFVRGPLHFADLVIRRIAKTRDQADKGSRPKPCLSKERPRSLFIDDVHAKRAVGSKARSRSPDPSLLEVRERCLLSGKEERGRLRIGLQPSAERRARCLALERETNAEESVRLPRSFPPGGDLRLAAHRGRGAVNHHRRFAKGLAQLWRLRRSVLEEAALSDPELWESPLQHRLDAPVDPRGPKYYLRRRHISLDDSQNTGRMRDIANVNGLPT